MSEPQVWKTLIEHTIPNAIYLGLVKMCSQRGGGAADMDAMAACWARSYFGDAARDYLRGQNREDHLVNVYVDLDARRKRFEATYVFSDPHTATMFKLAQG